MGFMDGLKKLTQPYDDDDDFFEGADLSFKPQPREEQKSPVSAAQLAFENAFAFSTTASQSLAAIRGNRSTFAHWKYLLEWSLERSSKCPSSNAPVSLNAFRTSSCVM